MYEPHLLQQPAHNEMLERLNRLNPSSSAVWGKMDVAQMMAHVTANLELAMSEQKIAWTLIGRLFGKGVKRQFLTKGIPKNSPTGPLQRITDSREFELERSRLRLQLEQFFQAGEAGITRQPHDFFGPLTVNEWARLQYLHTDHHFRQFGV